MCAQRINIHGRRREEGREKREPAHDEAIQSENEREQRREQQRLRVGRNAIMISAERWSVPAARLRRRVWSAVVGAVKSAAEAEQEGDHRRSAV